MRKEVNGMLTVTNVTKRSFIPVSALALRSGVIRQGSRLGGDCDGDCGGSDCDCPSDCGESGGDDGDCGGDCGDGGN